MTEIDARSSLDAKYTRDSAPFKSKLRTRLTQEDVIEIYLCKQSHTSPTFVSRLCGVSEKTVRDIWSGRTWSKETCHLDPFRTVTFKKIGRPAGSKDTKPRKARNTQSMPVKFGREQIHQSQGENDLPQAQTEEASFKPEADALVPADSEPQSSLSFSISIDELLHEWDQQGCWIDKDGFGDTSCPHARFLSLILSE
jgi:hypothetical protein